MKQIRRNVFETNSSSTHSLAIPKKDYVKLNSIYFGIGEYGWELGEADPASYLYTAIYSDYIKPDAEELINKLKDILDKNNIHYTMEEPKWYFSEWRNDYYCENAIVDHGDELKPFINELFDDEDKLLRFICGGLVFTGNDNNDESYPFVNRMEKDYADWGSMEREPNPYYMENADEYDWYYKGN